jgi:hypothetical protein
VVLSVRLRQILLATHVPTSYHPDKILFPYKFQLLIKASRTLKKIVGKWVICRNAKTAAVVSNGKSAGSDSGCGEFDK